MEIWGRAVYDVAWAEAQGAPGCGAPAHTHVACGCPSERCCRGCCRVSLRYRATSYDLRELRFVHTVDAMTVCEPNPKAVDARAKTVSTDS